ncbi:SsgA family sporulation/cell division regulator [Dactylosporangium sp. CA-052675]|uniref:SsgA family sporulation/cell division regulator n=1 Tax=Dactylosporangium sp. CA-052675 TaxID=3239927 RepID=UPI003D89D4C3
MAVITRRVSFAGTVDVEPVRGHIDLAYDTDRPFHVFITFIEDHTTWFFARDVLARRVPGTHDVRVDVDGMWTILRLVSPEGEAEIKIVRAHIDAFLAATTRAVPYGAEKLDFDAELDALLKDGAR